MKRTIISVAISFVSLIAHGQALGNHAADYVAYRNSLEGVGGQVLGGGLPALPTFEVDLLRTPGGVPILSGAGNWQWEILVVPHPFSSAIGVELGVRVNELNNATLVDPVFDTPNPGTEIFGWEDAATGGLQTNPPTDEIFMAYGSEVLPANSDPIQLLIVEAGSALDDSVLEVLGAYGVDGISTPGTNAIVAQETGAGVITNAFSGVFEVTGIPEPASALLVLVAAAATLAVRCRSAA